MFSTSVESLKLTDMTWQHYLTEIDGRLASVILDDRFKQDALAAQLPQLAWFGLLTRLDPGSSIWHPDEGPALEEVENNLLKLCGEYGHGWAVYLRCLDTRGVREFYFCTGGTWELSEVAPKLRALHPDYVIEFDTTSDPSWKHYKAWLGETRLPNPSG